MKKEKATQLGHLAAGLFLLAVAFDWIERRDISHSLYSLIAGCFLLLISGAHKWVQKKFDNVDTAVYLIETVAFSFASWQYKLEDFTTKSILFFLAALVYFIVAVITGVKSFKTNHHRRRKRRRRSLK